MDAWGRASQVEGRAGPEPKPGARLRQGEKRDGAERERGTGLVESS